MCPTIKKGHSCKAAHADSSRRESRLFKTCSRTSPSKRSRRRRGNFLGGFFQTRTLQRDPAVALFYSRTHKGGTEKKLNWISMTSTYFSSKKQRNDPHCSPADRDSRPVRPHRCCLGRS